MNKEEARAEYYRLLREHLERFGRGLPYLLPAQDQENIIEILRECLRTGKPYESPPLPEDCIS